MKHTLALNFAKRSFGRGGQFGGNYKKHVGNLKGRGPKSASDIRDEEAYLNRTSFKKSLGDGLMGQPAYEIDRDALNEIKWTDLVSESSAPPPQGVSPVQTKELATRRLLSLPLVNSLIFNRKFEWLTPVQAQTLLPILRNESVVVRAKTGTGKTAAFAIPILQKVLEAKQDKRVSGKVSALIVSPTRELAQQIADEIFKITQFGGLDSIKVQSLVGGISKDRQVRAAGLDSGSSPSKVADIVVATPGRLLDVLGDEGVAEKFSDLTSRVFDEADRILDIGFEREMEQIREIIDEKANGREIPLLLFSATADRTMRNFAQRQFGSRVKVVDTVPKDEPTANELVEQHSTACRDWADLYEAASKEIFDSYNEAKQDGGNFKAIVFLPTTLMVDHYERVLRSLFGRKSPLAPYIMGIHGQRKQQSRQTRADKFRKQDDALLITTDVVARGMDFPKVTHVFQLGPPPDVASYVHRIGRTARIGNSGKSSLFYTSHMRRFIDALVREHIKPAMAVYESDSEFRQTMQKAFEQAVRDDEEADEIVNSLMSYMTLLKSKFNIDSREFLRDMRPFIELMGLERLNLRLQQRQAWSSGSFRKRRDGYGSSRRTRMRW